MEKGVACILVMTGGVCLLTGWGFETPRGLLALIGILAIVMGLMMLIGFRSKRE
jgi:hypothetical protein